MIMLDFKFTNFGLIWKN